MLDEAGLRQLLGRQRGLISRRQVVEGCGGRDLDLARLVRRRDLTRVHPGVYVDHTGELTWEQRAWAAVLACWPAALCVESALGPTTRRPRNEVVHVAVARDRHRPRLPGVRLHRVTRLEDRVDWHRSPPRVRVEETVIDVWVRTHDSLDGFALLADVCGSRVTTPARIKDALGARGRVAGRELLEAMLNDVASGACSVLEWEYLQLERRHGLPTAERQRADHLESGRIFRDATYASYGVVVELDGRAHHEGVRARDQDLERDLDTVVADGSVTVRLGYGQVFRRGCRTAAKVAALLSERGWAGPFVRCPSCLRA